jgi:outer membrane protein OmpA-like peptidoglycan-associated protein
MRSLAVIIIGLFSLIGVHSQDKDIVLAEREHEYKVRNVNFNTMDSDFGVTYYRDSMIIFSSTREYKDNSNKRWKGNGQRFLNFYIGKVEPNGDVKEFESVHGEGNTRYHEACATFSKDGKTVYFTRNNYYENKKGLSRDRKMKLAIYIADVSEDGSWHNIRPFPYNSEEYNNGHPTLSLDGKTMYFTSDMPGTVGGTDIFMVEITESGDFGVPKNLGGNVNTKGREMFPFIAADGTLYFSSDGHKGYGRLDIFKTDSDELELAAVQNLGEPFNSRRDDFAYVLNKNLLDGYFSSNRVGGKGDDDIYFFSSLDRPKKEKPEIAETDDVPCKSKVYGVVKDANDSSLLSGSTVTISDMEGKVLYKVKVSEDGHYSYEGECSQRYLITAHKALYLDEKKVITTGEEIGDDKEVNFSLTPEIVKRNGKILVDIDNIYFDFDSAEITKQAAVELEKVIALMRKYPKIRIEGSSHTDCRGSATYNMKLSERRAKSSVNFIINYGGIDPSRIYAKGYGESQILNGCVDGVKCSDAEHAVNRRTEFEIINPEVLEEE